MHSNPLLKIIAKVLIPVIVLFALYVQFHGDYSPGGGFQAGVIFSSALLLHALVFGLDQTTKVITDKVLIGVACFGVLLYAAVGVVSMLRGGNFLNYNLLAENALAGQHIGIIVIELGVGLTVGASMLLIFFTFARRVTS